MYVSLSFRSVTSSVYYFLSLYFLLLHSLTLLCIGVGFIVIVVIIVVVGDGEWDPMKLRRRLLHYPATLCEQSQLAFWEYVTHTNTFLRLLTISETNGSVNRRQSNIKKCLRELTTNFLTPFNLMYRVSSFHLQKSVSVPSTLEPEKKEAFWDYHSINNDNYSSINSVYRITTQMCHNFSVSFCVAQI